MTKDFLLVSLFVVDSVLIKAGFPSEHVNYSSVVGPRKVCATLVRCRSVLSDCELLTLQRLRGKLALDLSAVLLSTLSCYESLLGQNPVQALV